MPKTKTQKQNILSDIENSLKKQRSLLFLDYKGIGVKDLAVLRKQLQDAGARLQVAKKTLLAKAFAKEGISADLKNMEGQIAVVYSFQDPIAGAKTTHAFARGRADMKMLGGYMENEVLDAHQVQELALLPSKEQLLGMFVATLAAPIQGFARVLNGNIKGLMYALSAIQEKKS